MTALVLSQPMFFPWLGMFEQTKLADIHVHYNDVQFSKGSFANRVQIKGPQGPQWLTAPIDRQRSGKLISETLLCPREKWVDSHIAKLNRYNEAPHFAEMITIAKEAYSNRTDVLSDFNRMAYESIAKLLGIQTEFTNANGLFLHLHSSARVHAICRHFGATCYITGLGARNYLDHELFEKSGIRVEYIDYRKLPYPQLFGEFTPFVSVLDAIANCGIDARGLLVSQSVYWKESTNVG